jgi:hypothetical protein
MLKKVLSTQEIETLANNPDAEVFFAKGDIVAAREKGSDTTYVSAAGPTDLVTERIRIEKKAAETIAELGVKVGSFYAVNVGGSYAVYVLFETWENIESLDLPDNIETPEEVSPDTLSVAAFSEAGEAKFAGAIYPGDGLADAIFDAIATAASKSMDWEVEEQPGVRFRHISPQGVKVLARGFTADKKLSKRGASIGLYWCASSYLWITDAADFTAAAEEFVRAVTSDDYNTPLLLSVSASGSDVVTFHYSDESKSQLVAYNEDTREVLGTRETGAESVTADLADFIVQAMDLGE